MNTTIFNWMRTKRLFPLGSRGAVAVVRCVISEHLKIAVQQIEQLLDAWSMAPSVKAIQAMRGIAYRDWRQQCRRHARARQVIGIFREERLLMQDAGYRAFAARVRYRLLPGVF